MKEPNLPHFDIGLDIKNFGFSVDGIRGPDLTGTTLRMAGGPRCSPIPLVDKGLPQRSNGVVDPAERQRGDASSDGRRMVPTTHELTTHA